MWKKSQIQFRMNMQLDSADLRSVATIIGSGDFDGR